MSIGIGIAALFSGLFCTSEIAAINQSNTTDLIEDCIVVEEPMQLMPQAVVSRNSDLKVIRMGTITDPVSNIWMVIPADVPVMGEPAP